MQIETPPPFISPALANRIVFGVAAGLGVLAVEKGLPRWITMPAMILSVGLAAGANAEHLPVIGPAIAIRRDYVRRRSQEMAAVGSGPTVGIDDAETSAEPIRTEEPTQPGVLPPGAFRGGKK